MPNRIIPLALLLFGLLAGHLALAKTLDRIVAVVDDDIVLASELDREVAKLAQQLQQAQRPLPDKAVLQKEALDRLILTKLQLAQAERLGIKVDNQTLAAAIHNIAQRNQLTVEQLREVLARDGVSFREFEDKLRQDILLTQLRNKEVVNRIQVSDAEIDAYLAKAGPSATDRKEVHLLHILVAVPEDASAEEKAAAKAKAEKLVQELQQGADFDTLAAQASDARQADLGWRRLDQIPTLFANAAKTLKKGGIAGPLRSGSGYHIVKLADYRGGNRQLIPQTHVRHILIKTDELTSDEEAREKLLKLRERLLNGEDFATLARSHSEDTGSAINGGDLGWVNPGDMVPAFEEVMNQTPEGRISEPFRTQFGWHILEVLGRRQHDATDEVRRRQARKAIRQRKAKEALARYLQRLRDEAYVEIRLDQVS